MSGSADGWASRRLLAAALAAAGRGWPVFPLHPYSKRPAITGWPYRATCDTQTLTAWWDLAPYNIGIACGPAGLLVLDLDVRPAGDGPVDGREVLAELADRTGAEDPRDTYTVATPSGGEHRYFTVPSVGTVGSADPTDRAERAARTTVGWLGPLIDTRAAGGYVVAAGSARRVSGGRRYYCCASPPDCKPAPAPSWLLGALLPRMPSPQGSAIHRPWAWAAAALKGEADRVRTASTGRRNRTLFDAACRLGRLAAAGLLDEHLIADELTSAASHHIGVENFTAREAASTITSGLSYGHQRPLPLRPG